MSLWKDSPMKVKTKYWKFSAALVFSIFLLPPVTQAQHYRQTNLVSNIVGMAPTTAPNLKNPWGLTLSAGSPWGIGNNTSGTSTISDGKGNTIPLVAPVPPPKGNPTAPQSSPTGA